MPQLDFFLYPHVVFWTIIIFLSINIILWNTAIVAIFKALKTRHLLIKKLDSEPLQQEALIQPTLEDVIKEIDVYNTQIKNN